ncbi:hypothetical protein [Streptomyces sp. CT34]|uniref:hypothetical protein n=1 Tax=Streptomyces sp. CT34 TaxID=1553907 RepID=UPI000B0E44C3|nr:hypothetical protein [Streptomyces sp. CT34]
MPPKVKPDSGQATKTASRSGGSGGGKKISAYNQFMKDELPKFQAKHPDMSHKDAFKEVAGMWKTSPTNPNKA